MSRTILLVDDEERICRLVSDCFIEEGFNVITALNGAQALIEFDSKEIDLIILDIMMPLVDGWEVCSKIRSISNVPIIFLTAKSDEIDNLKGYKLGADDYVTKPFSPKILLAKSIAIINRVEKNIEKVNGIYEIDDKFIINEPAYRVCIDGEDLNLSVTEFQMLIFLIKNKDIVLKRDVILTGVWGANYFGDLRIVDTNIKRLREKLKNRADYICTIRGIGYKFEVK